MTTNLVDLGIMLAFKARELEEKRTKAQKVKWM